MCSPSECGRLEACVAGRCLKNGATPAVARAERFVFAAQRRAVIPFRPAVRGLLTLQSGDELLFAFDLRPLPKRPIVEAYVLLSIAELDLHRSRDDVFGPGGGTFAAQPILESWTLDSALWKSPHFGQSSSALSFLSMPTSQLFRVDVRSIVQMEVLGPESFFGIAVRYTASSLPSLQWDEVPHSAWHVPQLEIYVEQEKSGAVPDAGATR